MSKSQIEQIFAMFWLLIAIQSWDIFRWMSYIASTFCIIDAMISVGFAIVEFAKRKKERRDYHTTNKG